jgi:hypothetical protein
MSIASLSQTLGELDAGSLESQATSALRDVAKAVRAHDKSKSKGKITLTLTMERAKGSGQLLVGHTLSYSRPTETGKLSEESSGDTLMYCNEQGALSVLPDAQGKFDFGTRDQEARA